MQNERTLLRAIEFANERNGMPLILEGYTNNRQDPGAEAKFELWYAVLGSVVQEGNRREAIFWWPDNDTEMLDRQEALYAIVGQSTSYPIELWYVDRYLATEDRFTLLPVTRSMAVFMPRKTLYSMERRDYRSIPGVEYDEVRNIWRVSWSAYAA